MFDINLFFDIFDKFAIEYMQYYFKAIESLAPKQ